MPQGKYSLADAKPIGQYRLNDTTTAREMPPHADFFENTKKSAKNFIGNVGTMVAHPLETTKGLFDLVMGAVGGAAGLSEQLHPDHREAAENMRQFLVDRYGSLGKAKETFLTDPVGATADLSSVLTLGGGSVRLGARGAQLANMPRLAARGTTAANALRTAGTVTDPLSLVTSAPRLAAAKIAESGPVGDKLKRAAVKIDAAATKASPTIQRNNPNNRIIYDKLDLQIPIGERGVAKARGIVAEASNANKAAVADLARQGVTVDPGLATKYANDYILDLQADPGQTAEAVRQAQARLAEFTDHSATSTPIAAGTKIVRIPKPMPIDLAAKTITTLGNETPANAFRLGQHATVPDTVKKLGRGLREEVNLAATAADPEVGRQVTANNRLMHRAIPVRDALEARMPVYQSNDPVSLLGGIGMAAGNVPGAGLALWGIPTVKDKLAQFMFNRAKGLPVQRPGMLSGPITGPATDLAEWALSNNTMKTELIRAALLDKLAQDDQ